MIYQRIVLSGLCGMLIALAKCKLSKPARLTPICYPRRWCCLRANLALKCGLYAHDFLSFCRLWLTSQLFRLLVLQSVRVQNTLRRGFAAAFAGLGLNLAFSGR